MVKDKKLKFYIILYDNQKVRIWIKKFFLFEKTKNFLERKRVWRISSLLLCLKCNHSSFYLCLKRWSAVHSDQKYAWQHLLRSFSSRKRLLRSAWPKQEQDRHYQRNSKNKDNKQSFIWKKNKAKNTIFSLNEITPERKNKIWIKHAKINSSRTWKKNND